MTRQVLIIDDDAKLAELLAEFPANYGFTLTHAPRPSICSEGMPSMRQIMRRRAAAIDALGRRVFVDFPM